jgi:hypothetical protein
MHLSALWSSAARSRKLGAALVLGVISLAAACTRNSESLKRDSRNEADAPECRVSGFRQGVDSVTELTGYVNVIVGDPPAGAGSSTTHVELVQMPGRAISLKADSARANALADAGRLAGIRVRTVGRFLCGDSATFWVTQLEAAPGARE